MATLSQTSLQAFTKRHSGSIYFALVFAISWGGILFVVGVGPGGFSATPEQFGTVLPYALLVMVAGPSAAGMLLTGLLSGRAGIRSLLSRLLRWRVGIRWCAVALLTAPLSMTAALLALSLTSPHLLPGIFTSDNKVPLLLMGIAVGLVAGIFEELGWTGFAIPRLRLRYAAISTGLIVGVLWAGWHVLVNFWSSGVPSGGLSLAIFLTAWLWSALAGQLPAYRVLMVWVYDRTGSLGISMLMHASLTASTIILAPAISGVPSLIIGPAYAAAMWVVVAMVTVANGGKHIPDENRSAIPDTKNL